ncbi:MAG: ABC transporter ATP-binding protein [SAR324 cluster bacterium]|nr:ABC transporter ATP-binding protein [SAR324 cluster bacterium]
MSLMSVHNVGKAFVHYHSELQRFAKWFGIPVTPKEETWVLEEINFEIEPGEALGIIGHNGAGKSTLLKMITGTMQPTTGSITIQGRIAAILELGMGFNPELSGRQNALHSAGLMGFTNLQIQEALPQIEAFAEVGEFFDEPMRTYSSGMQMRVAFSVATAFRPEILIIDEALSVGDAYFQHKSFSRIRQFQEEGTTLLIVSHDKSAIQSLCDRAILLEKGHIIKDGAPEEIFDYYNALIAEKENSTVEVTTLDCGATKTSSGTGEAKIEQIVLYNSKGQAAEFIEVGEAVNLSVKVKVYAEIPSMVLGYAIKDRLGQTCYGTNTWHTEQTINPKKGDEFQFSIRFDANLGVGSYAVSIAIHDQATHLTENYAWLDLAIVFDIINVNKTQFQGTNWIEPKIEIEPL